MFQQFSGAGTSPSRVRKLPKRFEVHTLYRHHNKAGSQSSRAIQAFAVNPCCALRTLCESCDRPHMQLFHFHVLGFSLPNFVSYNAEHV